MNKTNTALSVIVKSNFERMGSLSLDEVIEIIRPHYEFDVHKLIEAELRRETRRIIGSIKDANGKRVYYIDRFGNINHK